MTDRDWAAPGSMPASPGDDSIEPPAPDDGRSAPVDRVGRITMRPRGLLDLLDAGFIVIRGHPGLLLGLSAVFVTPLALLTGWLRRDLLDGESVLDAFSDPSLYAGDQTDYGATVVALLGGSLVQTFVGVGVGGVVARWHSDRGVELGELLRWLTKRSPVVVAAWFVTHVLQVLGLVAFLVGMPVVATLTLVVAPVIGVEGAGPISAIRRSFRLVRRRFAVCAAFFVVSGLMAALLAVSVSALLTGIGFVVGLDGGWIVVALGEMLGGTLSTAFVAAATVAVYFDLRVRTEGLDVELALSDVFSEPARS